MPQFKIVHLSFFGAALLVSSVTYGLNPTKIEAASPKLTNNRVKLRSLRLNSSHHSMLAGKRHDLISEQVGSSIDHKGQTTRTIAQPHWQPAMIMADNSVTDINQSDNPIDEDEYRAGLLRLLSLAFFFLFFVPLGIFYPLFLFYRMLLAKQDQSNSEEIDDMFPPNEVDTNEVDNSIFPDLDENELNYPSETKPNGATVSKLQIAFSPPANQLKKELSQVGFETKVDAEYDLVDLMHQTVAILVEQNHWTHVSYSSTTFPQAKIKPEFDSISQQERSKIAHQQTSRTNYYPHNPDAKANEESYSYVVVTLILCTSHTKPLFQTINTNKQLLEELIHLGKMEQDTVMKFELLWNPQPPDEYISNDQLLIEYSEMKRLL